MILKRIVFYTASMLLAAPGTALYYLASRDIATSVALFFILGELCTITMVLGELKEEIQFPQVVLGPNGPIGFSPSEAK